MILSGERFRGDASVAGSGLRLDGKETAHKDERKNCSQILHSINSVDHSQSPGLLLTNSGL